MNFLLDLGGKAFVIDEEQLGVIQGILDNCEIFSSEYNRGEDGGESFYTQHVYKQDSTEGIRDVKFISTKSLVMARLAGRKK
jgi:hypothetical protein|tara:strand:+ start:2491 stop:2736 length:246 start_codon:yes stop_codon:yes gene_type:complete